VDKLSLRNEYRVIPAGAQLSLGRGGLLRNGGRLHQDADGLPGYATPGCASVPDLVVHDKAGDRILEGLLDGNIRVCKTSAGSSFGCQEDYLVGRRGEFGRLADILIPFLVTRQLICGAGAVSPDGAEFCLSRPSASTRSRPLISTRDEAVAAAAGMRRLRVRVSDSTMSETTTLLKAGATDLVLRAIAAGITLPDLTLDNPVQAIGEVSRDITGRRRLRLTRGREMRALDIQRGYLAGAMDFADGPVPRRVLGLWERALDAIGTGNLGAIAREIDWVIKYQLIEQYRGAHGLPLSAPEVAEADLAYHDIDRRRGLYYQLQRDGKVERTARDIDIFEAKTVPPPPGRYRQAG
jgi:proteasome accessory factor A